MTSEDSRKELLLNNSSYGDCKILGRKCNEYKVLLEDIQRIQQPTGWFSGAIISLVAQYMCNKVGENSFAHHFSSLVISDIIATLKNKKPIHTNTMEYVKKQINKVRYMLFLCF
jgi:hypothetical protein